MTTTEFCGYADEMTSAILKIYGMLNEDNVTAFEPIIANIEKAFVISVEGTLGQKYMLLDKREQTPTIYFFDDLMNGDIFKQINGTQNFRNSHLGELKKISGNDWKYPICYGYLPGTTVLFFKGKPKE